LLKLKSKGRNAEQKLKGISDGFQGQNAGLWDKMQVFGMKLFSLIPNPSPHGRRE
jgi:hypothetical protein